MLNGDGKKGFIPVSIVSQSSSIFSSSSSALLLSSIQTASTLPAGAHVSPTLSQLYEAMTSTYVSVTCLDVQTSMSLPTILEALIFKIPLHLPSVTLSISSDTKKVLVSSSPLQAINLHFPSFKSSNPLFSSIFEVTPVQNISPFTTQITMTMPSPIITHTSSLVSTVIETSVSTDKTTEFN